MSVFSDQRIIDFIRANFVPVTADINKAIHRRDAEGEFFRKIAEQGHYAGRTKPTKTRQGLYVPLANGQLLASVNSRSADEVLEMMKHAITKFEKLQRVAQPEIDDRLEADKNFATPFPDEGMILRVTCRDLPRADDPDHETWRHNFDNVWLTSNEKKSFAPADPKSATVGQSYEIPSPVIARIARFHLIDHVKGEGPGWKADSVKISDAKANVIGVSGASVQIQLKGRVKCVEPPSGDVNAYTGEIIEHETGVDLRLAGRLTWDVDRATFTRFDVLAYGDRWGSATYNFRHRDLERNPMGFTLQLLPTIAQNMTEPKYLSRWYFD